MSSLFEKLGQEKVLFQLVGDFYNLVLEDERINGFFQGTDMVKLRQHQLSFLSTILGGPEQYSGRSMHLAHKILQLKEHHFTAVVENLVEAMRRLNVDEEDIAQVMTRLSQYKDQIVS
ncbi:group I truncated hemoglobin [Paenibacillus cymbidii]|uniref:group I truncated hemoglobin n=1 Tax=Paenibacillus cymbidii TaxID=1639034 RepID=UPI001080894A|nr:group 1 truncated hemoglobin [Paenibacillus cymbidii]